MSSSTSVDKSGKFTAASSINFKPINAVSKRDNLAEVISWLEDPNASFNVKNKVAVLEGLKELRDNVVGMDEMKLSFAKQVKLMLVDHDPYRMMNGVLYGEPGTGKSSTCKIIAKIISNMGCLGDSDLGTSNGYSLH